MSIDTGLRLTGMLLIVAAMVALTINSEASGAQEQGRWQRLHIGDAHNWSFIGGDWSDGEDGLIVPPPANVFERVMAFHTGRAYGDFEAEFKFRLEGANCGAGFIFRAQDARHYYMVNFPCVSQCARAEHFWALISKVGDSGWVDVLKMEMLHGVASEGRYGELWHQARLVVEGDEFRLWVDGRPFPVVRDDTYTEPGLVGFEAWGYAGTSSFQDVRLSGKSVRPKPWDATLQPVQNWFLPYPVDDGQQHCTGITRAPNGDLLMALGPGGLDDRTWAALVRSTDNGKTWSSLEAEGWPGGWIHTMSDGQLITLLVREAPEGVYTLMRSESMDNGKSWSEPVEVECAPFVPPDNAPEMTLGGHHGFLELHDGTLLGFQVSSIPGYGHESGFNIWEWGMYGGHSAWSIRSTDGGHTWSAPVPLNGPPAIGQKYDLCECSSNVQTKEGKVLSLVRPIYSPWMWEVWSDNNGKSWGPATSGPFPCYAATALATSSGALLVSGRMPGLGLYVSHDSGMTWKPYRIDTGGLWAMGKMYEVAPDLVLYVYMDSYESSLRAQFIRVTADGAEPAREMLPAEVQQMNAAPAS